MKCFLLSLKNSRASTKTSDLATEQIFLISGYEKFLTAIILEETTEVPSKNYWVFFVFFFFLPPTKTGLLVLFLDSNIFIMILTALRKKKLTVSSEERHQT